MNVKPCISSSLHDQHLLSLINKRNYISSSISSSIKGNPIAVSYRKYGSVHFRYNCVNQSIDETWWTAITLYIVTSTTMYTQPHSWYYSNNDFCTKKVITKSIKIHCIVGVCLHFVTLTELMLAAYLWSLPGDIVVFLSMYDEELID